MTSTHPAKHSLVFGRRAALGLLALAASLLVLPAPSLADRDRGTWISTWGASPQSPAAPLAIDGQTLRQVAHVSLGGERVRVRLSNAFGTTPLVVTEAHLARSAGGDAIMPGTDRTLTFGGAPSVTIPAGALFVSDPVTLDVPALANLTVSLYFAGAVSATTEHSLSVQTSWLSPPGNFAGDAALPAGSSTSIHWYFLNGIEVLSDSPRAAAIVTLGDSITDGFASTVDANRRWPNLLAARLQARRPTADLAVVDQGISGNRILHDIAGPNALSRLDRDVLAQSAVQWVVVLEGINDIGFTAFRPDEDVTADEIIQGHRQLIARAHARGLSIYGATLTPFEGTIFPGYFSPEGEVKRQAVNAWIRGSGEYDAVIDFDRAIRDPAHPTTMLPAYDSGDHLHPNDAGYQAMADAVDLSLFRADPRR
jgi:lysophospholipase L1-like esterase